MSNKKTDLGSPCSPRWDDDWIAAVNAAETKAARRVCGARTAADTPCTLEPSHENGRCRFHGGFDLTGAQPGNRNATIHGLYSRALQRCERHCTVWKTCPLSGDDVCKWPMSETPTCPYETTLYQVAVSDGLARLDTHASIDPMHRHLVQQTALLSVMMQRAAVAMSERQIVDVTVVTGEKYQMNTKKVSPFIQAYLRLSSEYRRYLNLLEKKDCRPTNTEIGNQDKRNKVDTSLAPEDQAELDTTRRVAHTRAKWLVDDAEDDRRRKDPNRAKSQLRAAIELAPEIADALADPNSPAPFPELAKLFEEQGEAPPLSNLPDPFAVMARLMGWEMPEKGKAKETEEATQTTPP